MSEFLEQARRIAAENHAAEQAQRTLEAQQRQKEQAERELSRKRAVEFTDIMRKHNIPKIPLCQIGGYYRVPLMEYMKNERALRKTSYTPVILESRRKLQESQGHKLSVITLGWVAAAAYTIDDYESPKSFPGVFVSETDETYECWSVATSRDTVYVTPSSSISIGDPLPTPNERALAADDMPRRVGATLLRLGIME